MIETLKRQPAIQRWLAGVLLVVWAQASAAEINPSEDGSHRAFLAVLSNRTETAYLEILGQFDQAVRASASNPRPLLEKCKFIEAAFGVIDDEVPRKNEDLTEALTQLEERFPFDPDAVLYRAERSYGPGQVEILTRLSEVQLLRWSPAQRVRRLETLAWALYHSEELEQAKLEAEAAMRLDPGLDFSLILASYYDSLGNTNQASRVLMLTWNAEAEPWQKSRKAQILAKAGYYRKAAALYDSLRKQPAFYVDPLEQAKVLEECDRLEEAREQLVAAASREWNPKPGQVLLFDFDLEHGDGETALASYRALCQDGLESDQFLRRRLALAIEHPALPWTGADFARLGCLLAAIALLILFPLSWVLPVHYIGLVRQKHGKTLPEFA